MTPRDVQAEAEWTDWTRLDGLWPLLRIAIDETDEALKHRLVRMERLGLMEFAHDGEGHLLYRSRMDDEARALALLDDAAQARKN